MGSGIYDQHVEALEKFFDLTGATEAKVDDDEYAMDSRLLDLMKEEEAMDFQDATDALQGGAGQATLPLDGLTGHKLGKRPRKVRDRNRVGVVAETPDRKLNPETDEERKCLALLLVVPGYPFNEAADLAMLRTLGAKYPTVDPIKLLEAWQYEKLCNTQLQPGDKPRAQIRNWWTKAHTNKWDQRETKVNLPIVNGVIDLTGVAPGVNPATMVHNGFPVAYQDKNGRSYFTEENWDANMAFLVTKRAYRVDQIPKIKKERYDEKLGLYRI